MFLTLLDMANIRPNKERAEEVRSRFYGLLQNKFGYYPYHINGTEICSPVKVGRLTQQVRFYKVTAYASRLSISFVFYPASVKGQKRPKVNDWAINILYETGWETFSPKAMCDINYVFQSLRDDGVEGYRLEARENPYDCDEQQFRVSKKIERFLFSEFLPDVRPEELLWSFIYQAGKSYILGDFEGLDLSPELEPTFFVEHRANENGNFPFTVIRQNDIWNSSKEGLCRSVCPFRTNNLIYDGGKTRSVVMSYKGHQLKNRDICENCSKEFTCLTSGYEKLENYLEFVPFA